MSESELNPYRAPVLDLPAGQPDPLSRSSVRRIAGTMICTGAAFWCLFPLAAFLEGVKPAAAGPPDNWLALGLLLSTGIAAFFLGLCIRRNTRRYIFTLFMIVVTMILLFPFALAT